MQTLIIFAAKYLIVLVVFLTSFVFFRQDVMQKKKMLKVGVIGAALTFLLSRLAGWIYFDPRPFVAQHFTPLIAHAADNGFPSDHALLGFTLASIVFFFHRRFGIALAILTLLISAARVSAGIHTWLDILGSFVISILSVWVVMINLSTIE